MQKQLPNSVDVAIIGAGIIGISTAWALARAGLRVAVFEKGAIGAEQSSRNWGWIRSVKRDHCELPLALRANALWQALQQQVDVGYRQRGLAYLAASAAEMEGYAKWLQAARPYGISARLVEAQALPALLGAPSARDWQGALYSAEDGVAEPQLATAAIAGLAREAGCQIFEHCAARGLDVAAGRVRGVVTESGVVAAAAVVLAGGAWSRLFCGNSGVSFPQLKVHASVLRTTPLESGMDLAINGGDFTCRKRADGGYSVSQLGASTADLTPDSIRLMRQFLPAWMAERKYLKLRVGRRFLEEWRMPRRFALDAPTPFEQHRILDPQPGMAAISTALEKLKAAFPAFGAAQVAGAWAGMIDVTPDALPVMSAVDAVPGFFLASGFSGHGFGIGPAAGELMSELVQGKPPSVDATPFRLSRFA
ncbi:oxidoreductase [Bordetella trematum]|uniref:Oxidoreductase n=1 Tax=Bordetella trematum TaxID=123899 RepID=A0A157SIR9_9BORD|nr:FAD-binding oxidoreductase [Bordetella trematum]CZZ98056.1 oxidoreductase [Bordetella trematum]SAI33485.1 oxidoreductase [Bordetella trematum]SAI69806.1 oxidoreductase [Bordetella trematum]SUV99101.1 oxidoreductase [Bordetella trematum]